ncbi:MAG: hypothetical protein QXH07_03630 [Thermoplasmata archaeon]
MNKSTVSLKDILIMVATYNTEIRKQIDEQQIILLDTFYAMIISDVFKVLKEEQFNLESLETIKDNAELQEITDSTIEYLNYMNITPIQQIEILLKTAMQIMLEHPNIQTLALNIKDSIKNYDVFT